MSQEERWQANYEDVMRFLNENHRNLSKYDMCERRLFTWVKHNRKLMNAGGLKPEREEKLTIVDFRHDSTMIKRAYHCARCSESLENFWK